MGGKMMMRRLGRVVLLTMVMTAGVGATLVVQGHEREGRLTRGADRMALRAEMVAFRADRLAHRITDVVLRWIEREVGSRGYLDHGVQEADEFTWSAQLEDGQIIEIKGINGAVIAEATDGSEVEVRAVKTSRRSDLSEVRIQVIEHEAGVTLCAVYPTPRGKPENECGPGSEGRMSVRDNDTKVVFHVRVPANVRFHGRTVNGKVEATGLTANMLATTVNGSIEIETAGYAEASTVNGSIEAVMGAVSAEGLSFSTVNGSINLDVPDDLDADVRAEWVNGRIETDLPFSLEGRVSRRSARGSLGAGGPLLELKTVNGSVRIH